MLHLGMAACWLILGGVLLAWQGMSTPPGWFAVAMALYNLVRWFVGRSSHKASSPRLEQSPPHRPLSTYNPDFDFTDRTEV